MCGVTGRGENQRVKSKGMSARSRWVGRSELRQQMRRTKSDLITPVRIQCPGVGRDTLNRRAKADRLPSSRWCRNANTLSPSSRGCTIESPRPSAATKSPQASATQHSRTEQVAGRRGGRDSDEGSQTRSTPHQAHQPSAVSRGNHGWARRQAGHCSDNWPPWVGQQTTGLSAQTCGPQHVSCVHLISR